MINNNLESQRNNGPFSTQAPQPRQNGVVELTAPFSPIVLHVKIASIASLLFQDASLLPSSFSFVLRVKK